MRRISRMHFIAKRVREIAPHSTDTTVSPSELRQAFLRLPGPRIRYPSGRDELWGANAPTDHAPKLFQAFLVAGPHRTRCRPDVPMYPEYARDTFTG